MILCDRPCSNKTEYGYCNTTCCINPVIPNTAVGNFPPPQTIQTNADRIRSMTDEELAELGLRIAMCPCDAMNAGCALNDDTCREAWISWLKRDEA